MKPIKYIFLIALTLALVHCPGGNNKNGGTEKNTPPRITSVSILPATPSIQSDIMLQILSSDKEGDPITYQVKWFVNDQKIGEGMTFKYEDIKIGDQISAEVTPFDGKDHGKPHRTGSVTVGGMIPRILSLSVVPESIFVATDRVTVNAVVENPNQDTARIICHWVVGDQTLADTSNSIGLRQFNLKKNDVVTGSAFAWSNDLRSEPFTFELHVANSAPTLSAQLDTVNLSKDSIYYQLPVIDPDGDKITYRLLEGPDGVFCDPQTGILYGKSLEERFSVTVRATDPDGAYLDAHFALAAR